MSRDIEMDAVLLQAGFRGGPHRIMATGMRLGFESPDSVMKYAEGLSGQPKEYVDKVVARATEIDLKGNE